MNLNRSVLSLAVFLVLTLSVGLVQTATAASKSNTARKTHLRVNDVTTIIAKYAEAKGSFVGANVRGGFASPEDCLTWNVVAPADGDYVVTLLCSTPKQVKIEVSSGTSVLSTYSLIPDWKGRPIYWRQPIPGVLKLTKGENRVSIRLPEIQPEADTAGKRSKPSISKPPKEFAVFSIELGTPDARKGQLERARQTRGDYSWMVEGKYGLFVHWSPLSYAFHGEEPRSKWHQKAVEMFDVDVFADAVERTGASWLTFTVTHGGFYWPGPSDAIDAVLPGRTTKRDLMGEIIEELDQRGIRTLFYFHTNCASSDDPEWAQAVGGLDEVTTKFGDNIEAILRESSLHYGKKLKGYAYIDATVQKDYPLDPPWERWAMAIRAGNPDALVGFSSQRAASVSPFSDLTVTDGGASLSDPDLSLIGPGKQYGDVQPAIWFKMDGWITNGPMNGGFGKKGPRYSSEQYVDYFKKMDQANIPVTINLISTADVVAGHPIFNPECMEIMEAVRKAIRGK